MKKAEYAKMAEREEVYWWHVGRLKIIETYLAIAVRNSKSSTSIMNIGCGTGGTLSTLEAFGSVENIDVSDDAIVFMKQNGYKVRKVTGVELPYKDKKFDVKIPIKIIGFARVYKIR